MLLATGRLDEATGYRGNTFQPIPRPIPRLIPGRFPSASFHWGKRHTFLGTRGPTSLRTLKRKASAGEGRRRRRRALYAAKAPLHSGLQLRQRDAAISNKLHVLCAVVLSVIHLHRRVHVHPCTRAYCRSFNEVQVVCAAVLSVIRSRRGVQVHPCTSALVRIAVHPIRSVCAVVLESRLAVEQRERKGR